jgi:hypothetical protein
MEVDMRACYHQVLEAGNSTKGEQMMTQGPRKSPLTMGRAWTILLAFILALVMGAGSPAAAEDSFFVGAASTAVNPPLGAFIGGDALNRRFEAHHDDIFAKAVVVKNNEEAVALVVIDCLGLTYPHIQQIRAKAAAELDDLPAERIVVMSTHSHCGPDVVGIYGPDRLTSGLDPDYIDELVSKAARQVVIAAQNTRPATAYYAETTHGEEWARNICEPGELDRSVTTLQFEDHDGKTIATMTNFACHPTILDGVHNVISSDYPGGFYRAMSEAMDGEHLFLQGAIGGWVQPEKGDRSFELADRYGRGLAADTLEALGKRKPLQGGSIEFANKTLHLPMANEGWKMLIDAGVVERDVSETIETEIAWFRIGEAQFATHPGETPPAYSLATKELMTSGPRFVLGLALDALGYILKPTYFSDAEVPHAEYLTSMSLGPETGPALMDGLKSIIPR